MRVGSCGLLVRGGKVLLALRANDRDLYPGVWDLVGGHCEGEETPEATLLRELEEELGIEPSLFEQVAVLEEPLPADYGEARYHVFVVRAWRGGEPRALGSEHTDLRWVDLPQAEALSLAHPDYPQLIRQALAEAPA